MAWSYVSAGTASSADRGSAGTLNLTPGAPSGSGGILLLKVSSRSAPTSFTTPSNWTVIANTASHRNAVYARVSDGGADDTPTMAVVLAASGCATATITRWAGGNTTLGSLLNGTVANLYGAAPGGINVPAKTPGVDNCLVLRGGQCQDDGNGPFYAAPSGDTFLCEDTHTSGYGEDIWACWVYRIQTTAAAVSSGQIDNNKTSTDSYAIGIALTAGADVTTLVPNPAGLSV